MNSVNDLNPSNLSQSAPTQTITLNTLRGSDNKTPTSTININTTNGGVTGVAEESEPRQTIRINPNRKKPTRRTIEDPSQINQVNPNDFIQQRSSANVAQPKSLQQDAISKLDEAINRKKQEYVNFVNAALEADAYNRERVEEGFETVQGEINYLPNDLPQEVTKDPSPVIKSREQLDEEEIDEFDRDIEESINYSEPSRRQEEYAPVTNTRVVTDPFAVDYDDFEDENIEEEEETVTYTESNVPEAYYDRPEDLPQNTSYLGQQFADIAEEEIEDEAVEITEYKQSEDIEQQIEEAPVEEKKVEASEKDEEKKPDTDIIDNIASKSITVSSQVIPSKDNIEKSSSSDFDINEDDFEDLTYEGTNEEQLTDDQIRKIVLESEKHLRNEILTKIIQAGKKLDTSSFVVSNKVISIKDALKNSPVSSQERTGEWPMMFSGRPFRATALKGPEIALMADEDNRDSNGTAIGLTNQQVRIIYEHDANPYKPATVEGWAKTIPFVDVESIFAALYVASLKGANYIPMACSKPSCMYSYLTDNTDINNLVKFGNDESKNKFDEIKHTAITPENTGSYESVVNVINDNFAIGLKVPSVFTILYEYASLNPAFSRKYTTVISIMQYVDYIYKINPETQTFEPIGWKAYPGDNGKTFKSKIATYAKILKEFDDTDFSVLIALINSMVSKITENRQISYEVPAAKCPKCGSDIPAQAISPRQLLFTRQRLVELATTPIER